MHTNNDALLYISHDCVLYIMCAGRIMYNMLDIASMTCLCMTIAVCTCLLSICCIYNMHVCVHTLGGIVNNDGGSIVLLLLIDHTRMSHGECFEAYK